MTTLEAIYENGIFKPISGVPQTLKEHERVRITIETDDNDLQTKMNQGEAANDEDSAIQVSHDVLRELLAEGMISHIPERGAVDEKDFEPIVIQGKPLSETVLEDRN